MKTEKSLKKAMTAQIKQVESLSDLICDQAAHLRHKGFDPKIMEAMRDATNRLVKAVHEYSAYRNAYETE